MLTTVAVVTFLAERGHPFRGHTELFGQKDNGNYLGLLELLSQFDPFLAEHIRRYGSKEKSQVSHLSSTICEALIKLLSDRVKAKIVAEIKKAKYYSISIDSTPDIAHIDQLSIVIRYRRFDGQPVERFLAFIDIEKYEGKYLFETLKYFLDECGIKLEDCRGQTYDNASNISRTYSGVQARFHQVNPVAELVPCAAHSLNLVGTAAVQNSVDAIARTSTQTTLIVLEAKSLVSKLSSLNIVLTCIVWNNILNTLNRVNKALQAPGIEIGSVVMHYRVLLEHIHSLRDSERFDRFENEAKSVAPGLDYDDENKRAEKRKLFHDETPEEFKVSDCRENFRVNTYLVIIDRLLSEIKKRKAAYTNAYER